MVSKNLKPLFSSLYRNAIQSNCNRALVENGGNVSTYLLAETTSVAFVIKLNCELTHTIINMLRSGLRLFCQSFYLF